MKENTEKKKGFFAKLKAGLSKTRKSFEALFNVHGEIDDDFYEELEEALVLSDMGCEVAEEVIEELTEIIKNEKIKERSLAREALIKLLIDKLPKDEKAYDFAEEKSVILVIGVNGVGKTTTIGKVAHDLKDDGKKVVLAAADTFRAAACEQLKEWGRRSECDVISQGEGADPAAVVFDAINAYRARKADVLICDTAGRLHNKKNLMDELGKIDRIINRECPDLKKEVWLVLDSTTGQNAYVQAKEFSSIIKVDGLVLTKLDGTAKGGVVIKICEELNIPIKYVGVGEKADDLQKFDVEDFIRALF
ncbi:MAG: signal recognition particle-docking protein FtsY [Lachnospiraceae bacterium]|nr:signal recognition particle-docking protein FtsY [Lachnospiraceae bacterium]